MAGPANAAEALGMAKDPKPKRAGGIPLGDPIDTLSAQIRGVVKRLDELRRREEACTLDELHAAGDMFDRLAKELREQHADLVQRRLRLQFGVSAEPAVGPADRDVSRRAPPSLSRASLELLSKTVATNIADQVAKQLEPLTARLHALEAKGSAPGMKFAGVWQRALGYGEGSVVTYDGSAWIALKDIVAGEKPSDGATSWQLVVKRGRDGKDVAAGVKPATSSVRLGA